MYSKSLDGAPSRWREKLLYKATIMVFMAQALLGMVQPLHAQEPTPNQDPVPSVTTPEPTPSAQATLTTIEPAPGSSPQPTTAEIPAPRPNKEVATRKIIAVVTCKGEGETSTCFFHDGNGNPLEGLLVPVQIRTSRDDKSILAIPFGTQTIPFTSNGILSNQIPPYFSMQSDDSAYTVVGIEGTAVTQIIEGGSNKPLELYHELLLANGSIDYIPAEETPGIFYGGAEFGALPGDVQITPDGINFHGELGQSAASLGKLQITVQVLSGSGTLVRREPIALQEVATFEKRRVGKLDQWHVTITFANLETHVGGKIASFILHNQPGGTQQLLGLKQMGGWREFNLNGQEEVGGKVKYFKKSEIVTALLQGVIAKFVR